MWVGESKMMLYIAIALVGYGNSNVFSMIFSQALLAMVISFTTSVSSLI